MKLQRAPGSVAPAGVTDPSPAAAGDDSIVTRLRARRRALERSREKSFELPGWEDLLAVRYRRLDAEELREITFGGDTEQTTVQRNGNLLVTACVEVYGLDEAGQRVALRDTFPMRFERDLADLMESPAGDSAYDVLLGLLDGHEGALEDHADDVYRWMRTLQAEEDEQAVGGR